jgi:ADP-ribosylglycohydrolase
MLGAIFGDIVGSAYEFCNTRDYNFTLLGKWSRPTDDTYMTLAAAKALMETYGQEDGEIRQALVREMRDMGARYPDAGYGGMFCEWLREKNPKPYHSFGNGSAMRVSAAGWLYRTLEETLHAAKLTAEVTHDHPEGIKGAQAIAAGIFLARAGADKDQIRQYLMNRFRYDLSRTLDEIRPDYCFSEICQESVPEAILAFYEGRDYEDVIRKAVSLGGDSDTIACMAGAIAEAFYGMPETFKEEALSRLDRVTRSLVLRFRSFYRKHSGRPMDGWREEIGRYLNSSL